MDIHLIEPVQMGWAIAVPIITSAISGMMQARANKKMNRPLTDQGIQESADKYFPGLFSSKGAWNPEAIVNPIQTRATGGPVTPGTPYLVGEKGPEVITPAQPGMVAPNPGTAPAPAPAAMTQPGMPTPNAAPAPAAVGGPAAATTTQATTPAPPGPGPSIPGNMNPVAPPTTGPTGEQTGGAEVGLPPGVGGTPKAQQMAAPPTASPVQSSGSGSQTAGGLAVQQMVNQLSNPGQISPAGYERKQEQANQGYNLAMRSIGGGLSSVGINPNSGYGLMMGQSAALNAMKLKNEANRDFTMASEQLKREDIKAATDNYLKFLETIFGLGTKRVGAMMGTDMMGPARAVGMMGQTLGDYFANKDKGTAAPAAPGNNVGPDDLN